MRFNPTKDDIRKTEMWLNRKCCREVGITRQTITQKQFDQMVQLTCYFRLVKNPELKQQSAMKTSITMLLSGVDNMYIQRLLRKIRYYKHSSASLMTFLIIRSRAGYQAYEEYKRRQAETNTFEYKARVHGMTKEQFDEYNRSRSVTEENLIRRHGEEKGREMFEAYRKRQAVAGCTLEYFIEKHGEEEGTRRYLEVNEAKRHTVDTYLAKGYTVEEAEAAVRQVFASSKHTSKIADEFCAEVIERITWADPNKVYSDAHNGEFGIYRQDTKKYYFYDLTFTQVNLIIEFNGDHYHANPNQFKADDLVRIRGGSKIAKDVWEADAQKKLAAEARGFEVVYVWESEYREDPIGTVNKIVEMLNDKNR